MTKRELMRWRNRVTIRNRDPHLIVERNDGRAGTIPWEVLQDAKDRAWGDDAVAIEVYPQRADVVNEIAWRHLWRVPEGVTPPNLKGLWGWSIAPTTPYVRGRGTEDL